MIKKIYNLHMFTRYKWPAALLLILLGSGLAYISYVRQHIPQVTFTTIEGKTIKASSLKGKLVLVNFWATDCLSCVKEMPALINTYRQYQTKGLEVIAVAMPYDPPAQVLNYVTEKKLPFPVMHDGFGEVSKQFGDVAVTPTTYIFDQYGKRLQRTVGEINFEQLHNLLRKELG